MGRGDSESWKRKKSHAGRHHHEPQRNRQTKKIEAAIRAIDCALTERPQAIFEITTAAQLIRVKAALLKALQLILRGEIPEAISHRKIGMARVITDQWPYNLTLGLIVIEAEQAFEAI